MLALSEGEHSLLQLAGKSTEEGWLPSLPLLLEKAVCTQLMLFLNSEHSSS